jgi:hypothetical protein
VIHEDEETRGLINVDSKVIDIFKKAYDSFKNTYGMVWVWEANYCYATKNDSLMARIKLAKCNDSIGTLELYFQRYRCQKLYTLTDSLTKFIEFLEKYQDA